MEINLNVMCKVQLTDSGEERVKEYDHLLDDPDYDEKSRILRISLWEIMGVFGSMMYGGYGKLPFEKNRIEIEE